MRIEIIESRLAHWDQLFNQYPEEQRILESARRFKSPEDTGPDYQEIYQVSGDLANKIQTDYSDWII